MQELKPEEFHDLAAQLEHALFNFESTSNHCVLRLYRKGAVDESIRSLRASKVSVDDNSVLMGAESESIFLVYLCVTISQGKRRILIYVQFLLHSAGVR